MWIWKVLYIWICVCECTLVRQVSDVDLENFVHMDIRGLIYRSSANMYIWIWNNLCALVATALGQQV